MNNTIKSRVSLAACNEYELHAVIASLQKILGPLGGIGRFVKPGSRALLKPNMLTALPPEKAATTHPCLVEAIAYLVREAGGIPLVGDSPGVQSFEKVAKTSGISSIGIPLTDFKDTCDVSFPNGVLCRKFTIAQAVRDADVIINLPKLKTHGQMIMTGAVKNMFGCVPGLRKAQFHLRMQEKDHFALMLLDLYSYIKPALSIIDGIVGMEGNGPGGGTPRPMGFLAGSTDAVALDTVCADIIGVKHNDIPYLKAAKKLNIGSWSHDHIEQVGDKADSFKQKDFKLPQVLHTMDFSVPIPQWILKKFLTSKPVIDRAICKKCHECVKICPSEPKALKARKEDVPTFNYNHCIRCFCCQEICPYSAITIKSSFFSRFIG